MQSKVTNLPVSAHLTVPQALDVARRDFSDAQDVLMVFYDADGELCIRSSHMTRRDALWMLEQAKKHTLSEST